VALFAFASNAWAQESPPASEPALPGASATETSSLAREEPRTVHVRTTAREESENPFRQSVLIFDQSVTTPTVGLGPTPQSYVPLYELWLSFRPRYYFNEHLSLRGRFDYTKELTNSQATTLYREDVFGDIWTDLVYGAKLDRLWRGTKASAGLRALWPTSKVSEAAGTYVTLGVTGGATHQFEIRGEDAPVLNDAHVGLTFAYMHPFTTATTPTSYGGFAYQRQDVDGLSFVSDQIVGETLVNHTLWGILDTGLQVTPRLSLTADLIVINQWHYPPTPSSKVVESAIGSQFTQNTWFVAYIDYTLFDELDLSLGYYNLANTNAPNGQVRGFFGADNIWVSPDARIFFDLTANLDVLLDDARGRHKFSTSQAKASRSQRIANHLQ
jgi:hypothetical protein